MPNWKKVIVSGSNAALNSLLVTNGITGSLLGTASYATQALSASYAANGGVTQLLAGPNITLSPTNGLGQVTVSATLSGSTIFNTATGSYGSFYDTTTQTNPVANVARSMSFNSTDITNGVSISGSTSPFNTYIKTENAGVYDIQFSAQVDKTDSGADEVVIWLRKNGTDLTDSATTLTLTGNNDKQVAAWNWFVSSATGDYYQIIWRSLDTDLRLLAEPISGTHPGIPSVIATVNRVDQFLSNTGSFSGSFTGTLLGTASYATQALSASHATSTAAVAGTTNYVSKFTSGTTIGNSVIYDDGTNVGIGTASPNSKLQVVGNTQITGSLITSGSSTHAVQIYKPGGVGSIYGYSSLIFETDTAFRFGQYTARDFYINNQNGTSGTVFVSSSGNMGLGTTNPSSNLQVQSNNLSAPAFAVSKSFSGGGDGTAVMHAFGYDSGIANTGIQVGVKGTGGFSTADAYPLRVFNQGTSSFDVKSNNGLKFNLYGSGTYTGTATQKLAVDSSGNVIEIPIGAGPVDGSGTANYITRWVDTDTITTSSIYETGGNIGIGTTSPGSLLQVGSGESTTDALIRLGVSYAGDRTSRGGISWRDGSDTTGKIYTEYDGTMVSMVFGSLYNSGYNSNNLMIIRGNGNVGIGTITPAYKLSVVGKIALNDGGNSVFIGDNAGQSDDATANINVGIGQNALQNNIVGNQNVAVGNNTLVANTNSNNTAVGSNSLQFNTTGFNNTGIGSYALNANLDGVSNTALGPAALLSNTSGSRNIAVGSSAARFNTSGSRNISIGTAALYENVTGSNNVAIGDNAGRYFGSGTSALTNASGSIFLGNNTRANANGSLNEIVIGTDLIGLGSNTVVLGNDNITTTALKGSVGIGTNVPMGPLEVYKANPAGLGGHLILNNDGSSVGNETAILFNDSGGGSVSFVRAAISSTTEGSPFNGDIKFKTGNTTYGSLSTRMIVKGNGDVGINTTSPSYTFDVNGTVRSQKTLYLGTGEPNSVNGGLNIGDVKITSVNTTQDDLIIYNLGTTVGTGAIRFGDGTAYDYDEWAGLEYHRNGILRLGGPVVFQNNGTPDVVTQLILAASSSNDFVITGSNGYVGIGTTTPSQKLEVNGNIKLSSTAGSTSTPSYIWLGNDYSNGTTRDKLKVYLFNSGTEQYGFGVGSSGDIQYHSNAIHDFYINNSFSTRINSTGVGIGTSSPAYLLDVNGTARVTTLIETSAAKYKTNIQPLEPQLSKVTQLEPVTFDWLDKPQTKTNIGLIADEVEKIYPEFVSKTEDGEIEGIEYSKLTTVLIQSIKELKEIVDQQQAQINKLLNK